MNHAQNHMQMLVNGLAAEHKKDRAKTQMTLGGLIDRLQELDQSMQMEGIYAGHSYRGYYSDLAFERCESREVGGVLDAIKACMGETFEGYKGGDFDMGRNTPVWIANYGSCGTRIMAVNDDGSIVTADEE